MSKVSEILSSSSGIPDSIISKMSKCFFCGKEIKFGGCWHGQEQAIGVCLSCDDQLASFLVDTVCDRPGLENMTLDQKVTYVKNICENVVIKKHVRGR